MRNDTYTFNSPNFNEIAEKVKKVLGTDRKWAKTASITLYYESTNSTVFLTMWDNVSDKDTLLNLIYEM